MTAERGELAPRWHTALLVGLMLAVALSGSLLQHYSGPAAVTPASGPPRDRILAQYVPILAVNWGLVLYVSRLGRRRNALPALLGRPSIGGARVAGDLALALAACALIQLLQTLLSSQLAAGRNAALAALLPSTEAERLIWMLVALSVGFCEEVVFRGYLQIQIAGFTGSAAAGVTAQAVLFGVAHLEQGLQSALLIAGYGLIFGVLAHFRRSLWPSIVAHAAVDLASGFWHP